MKNLPPTSASASVSASWLDRWNGEAHFEKEFQMAGQMVKSAIQAIPVPTDTGTDNFLGPTPKGLENLAQGLPWVSRNKRFALKGLEMRTPSGSKLRSLSSPYLVAPSGRTRTGELPRVNPGLCFLGHFGPRNGKGQTPSGRVTLNTCGVSYIRSSNWETHFEKEFLSAGSSTKDAIQSNFLPTDTDNWH
jgi:hypothetical protein